MVLPSTHDLFLIDSPDGFAEVLASGDLAEATAPWWTAAISACSSCLTVSASGDAHPMSIEWARVLVSILDAASASGLLRKMEILSRRVQVQVSALLAGYGDFGDAGAICAKALESLAELGERARLVRDELRELSEGNIESRVRIDDLAKLRQIVRTLAKIFDSISVATIRSELMIWISVFDLT